MKFPTLRALKVEENVSRFSSSTMVYRTACKGCNVIKRSRKILLIIVNNYIFIIYLTIIALKSINKVLILKCISLLSDRKFNREIEFKKQWFPNFKRIFVCSSLLRYRCYRDLNDLVFLLSGKSSISFNSLSNFHIIKE